MASNIIERFINIFVNTESANQSLNKTTNALDNVGKATDTVSKTQTKATQTTKNLTKETHSATESLIRNGGAMGLLNELTGGLAGTFKDAAEAISLAGVSLNTLKGALIATGIGAAVVAVGLLAANWDKVTEALGGTTAAQKAYNEEIEKGNQDLLKSFTNLTIAIKAVNEILRINPDNVDKLKAAFADLVKLIPELGKFDITKTEDVATVKTIIEEFFNLQKITTEIGAQITALNVQRSEFLTEYVADGERLLFMNATEIEQEIRLNKLNNNQSAQEQDDNKEKLEIALGIVQFEQRIIALKSEQFNVQAKINKLVGAKVFSDEQAKKLAEDEAKAKAKAISDAEKLAEREKARLERLEAIRRAIQAQVDAEEKVFNRSEIEKTALALNKQYSEILKIYDLRAKLIEQQKEAQKIAREEGGISEAEQAKLTAINNEIKAYDKLIQRKTYDLLLNSELDKFAQTRLDIIQMNADAELLIIQKNSIDAGRIRLYALEKENEMKKEIRDKALAQEQSDLYQANQALNAISDINSQAYKEALAVRNDLENKYNKDKIAGTEATLNEETKLQVASLEYYSDLKEQQKELDAQYYEHLMSVSSEFQGFLSQLQNRDLIRSKELRKVLLIAEKGLAIAGIVVGTIRQNNELKATAIKEGINAVASAAAYDYVGATAHGAAATAASAGIGLNTVSAGIAIASILATAAGGLSSISNEGGGGGATGGAVAVSPQAQFNVVGSSGQNQLASAIGKNQNQPVQAFVVGKTVTNQQELDRAINRTATFL